MKRWMSFDEKFTNVVAFFLFGSIQNMYCFGISLAAGEDILANTALPTSVVYVCDALPYFLSCLILPMLLDKISPLATVLVIFALMTTGAVLIAVPKVVAAKLVGVCLVAMSYGLNEAILFPLTAFYDDITMKAFIFGKACGGFFGIFYYASKQLLIVSAVLSKRHLIDFVQLDLLLERAANLYHLTVQGGGGGGVIEEGVFVFWSAKGHRQKPEMCALESVPLITSSGLLGWTRAIPIRLRLNYF